MKILEELSKKIDELKIASDNDKDKIILEEEKKIVEECIEVLKDDEKFFDYNFASIINVLDMEHVDIEDLAWKINDLKQAIDVRKRVFNVPFSDPQIETREILSTNLNNINTDIDSRIEALNANSALKEEVSKLEGIRDILANTGKKKYYTDEMFDSFYKQFDFESMSDEDFESMLDLFNSTKNFQGKVKKEKEDINNVINLFSEFIDHSGMTIEENNPTSGLYLKYIKAYENEICQNIDLDNAREILSFFKEKGIINNFEKEALVMISTFASSELVKSIYSEIMNNYPEEMESYYTTGYTTAWVVEENGYKKNPFRTSTKSKGKGKSLYSKCHKISNAELRENIKLLNEYSDMFVEKYNMSNIGAHINVLTNANAVLKDELKTLDTLRTLVFSRNWTLRKNLDLLKVFNIGNVYKIPVSTIGKGDLENKIHLAMELGLLNPPMDHISREMDKDIITNQKFVDLRSQEGLSNNTIRNYFARNTAVLASMDINSYGFMAYKLNQLGYTDFYNYFFSEKHTGDRAVLEIQDDEKRVFTKENVPDKDKLIEKVFVTDYYHNYINGYDKYDLDILNENEENKTDGKPQDYYDPRILDEELIKELEDKYRVTDKMDVLGQMVDYPNEYLYKLGDILISRFKVLRNATILKEKNGYLNKDMLLTSIVRNSFLTSESLEQIKGLLEERNVLL